LPIYDPHLLMDARTPISHSVCNHDCPTAWALEVELLDERRIGQSRGEKGNDYTVRAPGDGDHPFRCMTTSRSD